MVMSFKTMGKDHYIYAISKAGDKYGNTLIKLLAYYQKSALKDLTYDEVKEYYEKFY